jgi:predicted nucleic acid-binding protein
MAQTKIVVDADVIIHFSKAEILPILPTIFPEYQMVVLSVVLDELKGEVKTQIENMARWMKDKIELIPFNPQKEMRMEYALLLQRFGKGESACMAYCRYTNNVIGSSNLRDIKEYCESNQMIYLTTIDFLYYAIQRGIMSIDDAHQFIEVVREKGSKLPDTDFYVFRSQAIV